MNRRAILPAMSDASTVGLGSMVAEEGATTSSRTARAIRFFLLFEAATYVGAALAHFGIFVTGYEHRAAGTAESVIAGVLLIGWVATWTGPTFSRGRSEERRVGKECGGWDWWSCVDTRGGVICVT